MDSAAAFTLIITLFILNFQLVNSQLNATAGCSDAYKFSSGSQMGRNIQTVLANLLRDAPSTGYNSSTQGSSGDTVYGVLQCRGDLSPSDCRICAAAAVDIVNSTCVRNSTKGGRVFLDTCLLRYEDHFFASTLDTVGSQVNCSPAAPGNSSGSIFDTNLRAALSFIKDKVPSSVKKFVAAVSGIQTPSPVYILGQCIPDVNSADCRSCLGNAQDGLSNTCPSSSSGGVCYYPTCTLQYENSKFFGGVAENATILQNAGKDGASSLKALAIGVPVGVVAALVVLASGFWFWRKRSAARVLRPVPGELDELHATLHRGPVTFTYELLKRSTDDFSDLHKLGEGGFGAVYKGVFADGTELAIKKLSVASKQGEAQFLNEVKVISSVQHRNLVKLLGCCVQASERLLVYEFLVNNSLEKALFDDKASKPQLSWEMRYSILMGTARGLAYLHEDSQVRIVHRDIKPSNILLDEAFEAKISDFGLARLYGEDETSEIITTKVAGTYGYMAPEYAFHGHLSEKADVFSFGIVMLETVSGRKNRDLTLPGEEQYLLEWAWQLHAEGMLHSILDPTLIETENNENSKPEKTLLQAVHIALMCTQNAPQARPSMSHVVAMLSGHSNVKVPIQSASDVRPMAFSSGGTSSAASNDSKHRRKLEESFSQPEPR